MIISFRTESVEPINQLHGITSRKAVYLTFKCKHLILISRDFSAVKGFSSSVTSYALFILHRCRSQWPRGLRHEPSSPAKTLGSWVRISLEACMSVCVYSVFVLSCVQVAALRQADPLSKESYRLCKRSRN
jgi:hypothetical protein